MIERVVMRIRVTLMQKCHLKQMRKPQQAHNHMCTLVTVSNEVNGLW